MLAFSARYQCVYTSDASTQVGIAPPPFATAPSSESELSEVEEVLDATYHESESSSFDDDITHCSSSQTKSLSHI
jgi:hypothetical protein